MVNMGSFMHILAPTQHAAFSRCPALLMLGLRAGAGDSSRSGVRGAGVTNIVCCVRQKPPDARRHPYESRLHLGLRGGRLS